MDKKELVSWLKSVKKSYKNISNKFDELNYQKGLMDGAEIAMLGVINKIEEDG